MGHWFVAVDDIEPLVLQDLLDRIVESDIEHQPGFGAVGGNRIVRPTP